MVIMVKRYYDSILDFENTIKADKVINANEAKIYFKGSFVYKIFNHLKKEYYKNVHHIKKLANLDNCMFTIPIELIYIDGKFYGFKMLNAGLSLWSILLNQELSFDEKKLIAYQLKNISEYLKRKRLVHPDIHLCNILYLDNLVRLTDINGILNTCELLNDKKRKKLGGIKMSEIFEYWLELYGAEYLDYLEINFCMHVLFNIPKDELNNIYNGKNGEINPMGWHYASKLIDYKNSVFKDDVAEYFNACFNREEKTLLLDTYLIDHLK